MEMSITTASADFGPLSSPVSTGDERDHVVSAAEVAELAQIANWLEEAARALNEQADRLPEGSPEASEARAAAIVASRNATTARAAISRGRFPQGVSITTLSSAANTATLQAVAAEVASHVEPSQTAIIRSITLDAQTLELIDRRARADLSTREGLREYVKTYDVPEDQVDEVVEQLENSPSFQEAANESSTNTPEENRIAITNIETAKVFARQLASDEDAPPNEQAFARSVSQNNGALCRDERVRAILAKIERGETPSQREMDSALTSARAADRAARDRLTREGVTNPAAQNIAQDLEAVNREVQRLQGHGQIVGRAMMDNQPFNGQAVPENSRRRALEGTIREALRNADLQRTPEQIRALVDAQMRATPHPSSTDVTQNRFYREAMSAGYDAMLEGNAPAALRSIDNVVELLRIYGKDETYIERVRSTLTEGARLGTTTPGQMYLRATGKEAAIASQAELIRTGRPDSTMQGLMGIAGGVVGFMGETDPYRRMLGNLTDDMERLGWADGGSKGVGEWIDNDNGIMGIGRGSLSVNEIETTLRNAGITLAQVAGRDHDITAAELNRALSLARANLNNTGLATLANERYRWDEVRLDGGRGAKLFDTDNNGRLTMAEIRQGLLRAGVNPADYAGSDGVLNTVDELGRAMNAAARAQGAALPPR